jgi:hypothetical protein
VLAAAMLTSNANQVNLLQKQKFVPATNYSPPTCHSALQAVKNKSPKQEQGQTPAREFAAKFEIGSGPVRPPESHYQFGNRFSNGNSGSSFVAELSNHFDKSPPYNKNNNNNNNNNNEDDVDIGVESNRKLARTWSVGKLVNNFETPSHPDSDQSNSVRDLRHPTPTPTPTNVYHKFSAPSLPSGFQVTNGSAKPFLAPKPPSLVGGVKPLLRHTVSLVIPVARG